MATSSSLTAEMEHITQEMYKKNFELAEHNKTLSVLRKIEEVALSSVTDLNEVMQRAVDIIVVDGGFRCAFVYQVNHNRSALVPLAARTASSGKSMHVNHTLSIMRTRHIPLKQNDSGISKTAKTGRLVKKDRLYFTVFPQLDMLASQQLQTAIGATSFFSYPLIVRETVIGVLTIGVDAEDGLPVKENNELMERLPNSIAMAMDNSVLYQSITQANVRLKELDHLKDEFVSIASHELRTPMTAVKSYIWMALNKGGSGINPKVKEYLRIASVSTERLIKLVGDMLTISRIEGRRLQLNVIRFPIQDLLRRVHEELSIKAHEQRIRFSIAVPQRKIYIKGDMDKLHEVVQNLVGNALKFTPAGGSITVSTHMRKKEVEVQVRDTGPGMSKDDIDKLFQKFGMLGNSYAHTTPNTSGTGLGLYITKQIVMMHKGRIWVESTLGHGSTFFFTLPLQ